MKQYTIAHYNEAFEAYKQTHEDATRYDFWELLTNAKAKAIDSCQAWVLTDENGNKYLQSYNTIVSVKFAGEDVHHLGKWSITTSKHQSYFYRYV